MLYGVVSLTFDGIIKNNLLFKLDGFTNGVWGGLVCVCVCVTLLVLLNI